jgi:hypothetical protein
MHDWKRVPPTIYHHFHQQWTISICDALNAGLLPPGYSALVEQYSSGLYPDVLALQRRSPKAGNSPSSSTLEVPRTRMVFPPRPAHFHERANRVAIRHHLAEVVCAIEVVSPGNKAGKKAVREFASKAVDFLRRGINLLIVDPFPPGAQDPQTLHKLIWDEFDEGVPFELPPDEPLLLASYRAATPIVEFTPEAFIEPLAVGAELPDMPAWLDIDLFVNVPLESTYRAAWEVCPAEFRRFVEEGELADESLPEQAK